MGCGFCIFFSKDHQLDEILGLMPDAKLFYPIARFSCSEGKNHLKEPAY
jgi:hypothetical protein